MRINYRVYMKPTAHTPWHDTGIIESNKEAAEKVWAGIVKSLRYYAFKLEAITYGIAIQR